MRNTILLLFLLVRLTAQSEIKPVVKAVHDGDSYKILFTEWIPKTYNDSTIIFTKDLTEEWCRLEGVDTPELLWPGQISESQPFGREIGDSIRALIKGKSVSVQVFGKDQYRRTLVRITDKDFDLGEYILSRGWGVYVRNDLDKKTRRRYQYLRDQAVKKKIGMYSQEWVTPKVWRETHH